MSRRCCRPPFISIRFGERGLQFLKFLSQWFMDVVYIGQAGVFFFDFKPAFHVKMKPQQRKKSLPGVTAEEEAWLRSGKMEGFSPGKDKHRQLDAPPKHLTYYSTSISAI